MFISFLQVYFIVLLVSIITFSQSAYMVNESSGAAQVVLVLTNPLSNDLTVEVTNNDVTALGKNLVYV